MDVFSMAEALYRIYFQGEQSMKSYENLLKMPRENESLLKRVKQEVRSVISGAEIILYGSRARGDADSISDWDFLILVDQPLDRNLITEIKDRLYDLELVTDTILSSIIRTRKEWDSPRYSALPFKRAVEQEGVQL
jgi:predicted nucleotidyltransferase